MSEDAIERRQRAERDDARARAMGRLSVRDRVRALVEISSFEELTDRADGGDPGEWLAEHGLLAGTGRVGGRGIVVIANDPSDRRGSMCQHAARKACMAIDRAIHRGFPIVWIVDSDGARLHASAKCPVEVARMLDCLARASGRVPIVAMVANAAGAEAGVVAAMADFVVGVSGRSFAYTFDPDALAAVGDSRLPLERLGGMHVHTHRTGLADAAVSGEPEAIAWVRRVLAFLPSAAWEGAPRAPSVARALRDPPDSDLADVHEWIGNIFDAGSLVELGAPRAKSLLTGLARVGGLPVGIVATNPAELAGAIDLAAAEKCISFVRRCAAFALPVVSIVHSAGFVPNAKAEHAGFLVVAAAFARAMADASEHSPRVAMVIGVTAPGAHLLWTGADRIMMLGGARCRSLALDTLSTIGWHSKIPRLRGEGDEHDGASAPPIGPVDCSPRDCDDAVEEVPRHALRDRLIDALSAIPPKTSVAKGERRFAPARS